MLENEKILKFDIITEIRKRIPMCFTSNGQFIISSVEKNNASELKIIIIENNVDRIIIEDIVLGYLFRNNHLTHNVKDQVYLVLDFFFKN
ncbi:hypothetical protein [Aquimarina megaterium]|uniref:hypothetical protein n=1 Tax=Aquimarina megaterium TaxID=1443666 RepID=UPI00111255ED|nr:hypothetical protein [Aquimarina megaterium]